VHLVRCITASSIYKQECNVVYLQTMAKCV